ncbi:MAG: HAD-IA family hydrolase [Microgenomates group bacterium]
MITFVYFDVGGVLIRDFSASSKWKELQKDIGVTQTNEAVFNEVWMSHRNRVCVDFDVDSMIDELNTKVGLTIPKGFSLLQGFVDRFEKNETIFNTVSEIQKQVRVGLLTNMYPRMLDMIQEKGILPPVPFDVVMDSSVVKLQKPDSQFFMKAQQEAGVKGEELLFIDNQEKHVNAAKQLGWQTFHYDSADYEGSSSRLLEFFDHVRTS